MFVTDYQGITYFEEFVEGDKCTKEALCNFLGHDELFENLVLETCVIPKGVCGRCGEGYRYFKLSSKQSNHIKNQIETLR